MDINELLNRLNITKEPVRNDNGSFTIDIDNSNEYSSYYSKLNKADFLEQDDEASQVSIETSSIQFLSDDFTITLLADFDNDSYKMIIREMENKL